MVTGALTGAPLGFPAADVDPLFVSLPVLAGEMVYEILQGVGMAGEATVTVRVEPTL